MVDKEEWYKNITEKLNIPILEKAYHNFATTWDLPEEYIRSLKDYVDWNRISMNKNLSLDFLREFSDNINWEIYKFDNVIQKEFMK